MKGKIAAPIGALLLALALHAPAQVGACKANAAPQCRDSQVISASGNSIEVWGNGALTGGFEEVIAGTPDSVSIVIQGCADGGTCTTLDTYATVANSVRAPAIAAPYAYYKITATWSGGTNVSVTVNTRLTTAALGGGALQTCNAAAVPNFGSAVCQFTLTSAEILAFDGTAATGVPVILAPGAGRAIMPNGTTAAAEYVFNTTPYSAQIGLSSTWDQNSSGLVECNPDTSQSTSQVSWSCPIVSNDTQPPSVIENVAFSVYALAPITSGDGIIILTVPYTVYPIA